MTTPLIAAIARGIRPEINEGFDDAVGGAWSRDLAQAALTALTEAGYAIVRDDDLRMANGALATHGLSPLMAIDTKEGE